MTTTGKELAHSPWEVRQNRLSLDWKPVTYIEGGSNEKDHFGWIIGVVAVIDVL